MFYICKRNTTNIYKGLKRESFSLLEKRTIAEKYNLEVPELRRKEANATPVIFNEMSVMYVPLVNQYAYGGYQNGFGDDEYLEGLPKLPWADDVEHRGEYICFEVRGDSMDNGDASEAILERDILLCRSVRKDYWKSQLHIKKWDFVIVHKENNKQDHPA